MHPIWRTSPVTLLITFFAAVLPASVHADGEIAIRGARIVNGDGSVIERGHLIISGMRIAAVGPDLTIPPGAQIIEGAGLTIYPGLIDTFCLAGVAAPPPAPAPPAARPPTPGLQRGRRTGQPQAAPAPPLVWRKPTDGFDAKSAALQGLRNKGFTAALFGTRGTLTPGQNSLMNLNPGTPMVVRDRVSINVNTLSRGRGAYPGTLMGAYAFLRQAFYDGMDQRNRSPEKPDARLDGLGAAAAGEIPFFYAAQTENDIKRAIRFGREFNARILVLGGREAEKVIPYLRERKTPVVLTEDWLPAIALHKAGIPFALGSNKIEMSASEADDMRDRMIKLVEKGLSPDIVLKALTRVPAELLGVNKDLGSIEAGKLANLTVVEGDLFRKDGKVKFVVVGGARLDAAAVTAEASKRPRSAEDGLPYASVSEDDADRDGGTR